MELRKLEQKEHGNTRKLWETVFSEDTREFLDYYYFLKTRDNEIFVMEEEGRICSMIHLNPYTLRIEEDFRLCHYIVGVATGEPFRKRGYMGMLLRRAMQEMYGRKEPFTFLMPAAERIYTPYDFRFVYDQRQTEELKPEDFLRTPDTSVLFQDASLGDAREAAAFAETHFAGNSQVCARRDEVYYQTLMFEQQSERGGLRLIRAEGRLVGLFAYGDEDALEIREPLYLPEYEWAFQEAAARLAEERGRAVKLYAWEGGAKKQPLIMARLLHLETMLSCMKVRQGEEMDCSFAVLDSILPQNSRIWRIRGGADTNRKVLAQETEDSEGVITIGALAGLLFGYRSVKEAAREEDVFMTEHLKRELEKLQVLKTVCLNEIV